MITDTEDTMIDRLENIARFLADCLVIYDAETATDAIDEINEICSQN